MKISAFCLTTNATKFGYPFIESIKSWLKVIDELVVVDGGSTDDTVEQIKAIGDNRIRIIQDEDSKWEDDWSYGRMGHNFNRGYHECTGDIVIKFDIDYVLDDSAYISNSDALNFRKNAEFAIKQCKLVLTFNRLNFVLADRYFYKRHKTLAVNRDACKRRSVVVDYGLDMKRWAWGYEPIVTEYMENGIRFGSLINTSGNFHVLPTKVFNYGFAFSTKEQIQRIRYRHEQAEIRQKSLPYKRIDQPILNNTLDTLTPEIALKQHIDKCIEIVKKPGQIELPISQHPSVMYEKLKTIKPDQQGYNVFGKLDTIKYA